jgi:ribosomal protein S18 acetylase RimI-like enzyme
MEVKIDNLKWYKVKQVTVAKDRGETVTVRLAPERITDVKLNGKQLFGNSEQVIVQLQYWYKFKRYLLTLDGASVQLELYDKPLGDDKVTAYIYALWVDESDRRQGKATKLMDAAERIAKQCGYKEVFLEWNKQEAERSTLEWYERRGYDMVSFGMQSTLLKKQL